MKNWVKQVLGKHAFYLCSINRNIMHSIHFVDRILKCERKICWIDFLIVLSDFGLGCYFDFTFKDARSWYFMFVCCKNGTNQRTLPCTISSFNKESCLMVHRK